jgi:hypothetical protein
LDKNHTQKRNYCHGTVYRIFSTCESCDNRVVDTKGRIWEKIEKGVTSKQKTIKRTPRNKLKDVFINILFGGHGIIENKIELADH